MCPMPFVSPRSCLALILVLATASASFILAPMSQSAVDRVQETQARLIKSPPSDRRNSHYVSNRAPLAPSPLVQLPIRDVEPGGWLRKKIRLQSDGSHGNLGEI